ncbi:imidazole glycerol phosphate synthase subunit HisH [Alsobacter sp. R-9]
MTLPSVVIVDYGVGNLRSIQKMAEHVGMRADISGDHAVVAGAARLILPGVGHFGRAVERFRAAGLEEPLKEAVIARGRPLLGLCVGAQMLLSWGEEGEAEGLALIPGRVVRLQESANLKVPNVGWREVVPLRDHDLFERHAKLRFYFMHSYRLEPEFQDDVVATSRHGQDFAAVIGRGAITGVQFHPEKSHLFGVDLFQRFART